MMPFVYRWWTVSGWWGAFNRGVKLGPVTINFTRSMSITRPTRWLVGVYVLNRWILREPRGTWS